MRFAENKLDFDTWKSERHFQTEGRRCIEDHIKFGKFPTRESLVYVSSPPQFPIRTLFV